MLYNSLKTDFRGLMRQPIFAAVNITGLAVGLACGLLILAYVQHELSYEDFNDRGDRVFLLMQGEDLAGYPALLTRLMVDQLPQVEAVGMMCSSTRPLLSHGQIQVYHQVLLADRYVPELLDLPFVRGDRSNALVRPYTMVISERIAQLYFGEQDPVGKALRWDSSYDVEITGVFEHPSNTHFRHDLLVSMRTMEVEPGYHFTSFDSWVHGSLSFYVLLARGASRREFGADLLAAAEQVAPDRQLDRLKEDGGLPFLRSVRDLHLHQDGRNRHVYILATIGVFVLLVACVNFINLCTARSSQRAREVGIRKAAGAQQGQLASQFLVGSALQVLVAAGLGWLLAWTCGPAYEALTGFQLQIFRGGYSVLWPCLALATVALLGAGFPALVLARMHPARVFRDASRSGPLVVTLRRRLVEFQFVLAILLTLGTTVVYRQLEFIRHSDLGFRKEQVITFKAMSEIPNG